MGENQRLLIGPVENGGSIFQKEQLPRAALQYCGGEQLSEYSSKQHFP